MTTEDDTPSEHPLEISLSLSEDTSAKELQDEMEESCKLGILKEDDLRLATVTFGFVDEAGTLRENTVTAQGFDPEDYE